MLKETTEIMNDDLINSREAAKMLGISVSMLAKNRMNKGKIPYIRIEKRTIRYSRKAIEEYKKRNTRGL